MKELTEQLADVHEQYREGLITHEELVNKVVDLTYQWALKQKP